MRLTVPAMILAALFALVGCQQQALVGGKEPPEVVRTVASLSPGTTEIVGLFSDRTEIVGRTRACNFPTDFPDVPIVADTKPNFEELTRLKPDLIVYDATLFGEADVQKLQQLGIDLWPMDVQTVDQYIDWLERTGARMQAEVRMAEYADKVFAARQGAQARQPKTKPKVAVLMGEPASGLMIAGTESFQADVVRASGGEPVGPSAKNWVTVNVESLIGQGPDVIVTDVEPHLLLEDARLKETPAVKGTFVVQVNPDILLRTGARVDTLIENLGRYFQYWGAQE